MLGPEDGGGPRKYLPKADDIIDPWGNLFAVLVPGDINAAFDILSYGKDASPGGEGEDQDITQ
ncbi:MAG: type II secretion system protein GspG [Phycisphaerales bacterium]|nr:type II secretion system protein GspG [Phycisphaerales bacterium]